MKNQFIRARVSQEIVDQVEELVKHYSALTPVGTVNKTIVIELAIRELYQKILGGQEAK